jgi:nitrate/nitrite transporter NarK
MASIGVGTWLGTAYPMVIGNFAGVVLGAFGGMALADRWGARSVKPLAFVTGVLMLIALMLALTVMGAPDGGS